MIHAVLVFTTNNVFVKIMAVEYLHEAGWNNSIISDVYRYVKKRRKSEVNKDFTIANSNITKVWLKKFGFKGKALNLRSQQVKRNTNGFVPVWFFLTDGKQM